MKSWPKVAPNDDGIQPAGDPAECFYCHQHVGLPHMLDCVIVSKRVRLRYIYEVDVDVPHSWSEGDILFHRNESSWCCNNADREIHKMARDGGCNCSRFTAEFVTAVSDEPRRKLRRQKGRR